jgi:peroxiredoxin
MRAAIIPLALVACFEAAQGFAPGAVGINRLSGLHSARAISLRGGSGLVAAQMKAAVEGDTVPDVVFKCRVRDENIGGDNPFTWKDVTTKDLFKGKRVVVFSLPGAFTPTCSSTHLPGYESKYEEIKACGVDEIYCLSVNDAFVMRQWGLHQKLPEEKTDKSNPLNPGNFQKVKLLPDGACLFTRGMGMSCTWDTERGFGERSWRYSAVINDCKVCVCVCARARAYVCMCVCLCVDFNARVRVCGCDLDGHTHPHGCDSLFEPPPKRPPLIHPSSSSFLSLPSSTTASTFSPSPPLLHLPSLRRLPFTSPSPSPSQVEKMFLEGGKISQNSGPDPFEV